MCIYMQLMCVKLLSFLGLCHCVVSSMPSALENGVHCCYTCDAGIVGKLKVVVPLVVKYYLSSGAVIKGKFWFLT